MTHRTPKHAILPAAFLLLTIPQLTHAQSAPLSGLFAREALSGADAQLACFRAETAKLRAGEGSAAAMAAPAATLITPQSSVPEASAPLAPKSAPAEFAPLAKEIPKSRTVAIRSTVKTARGYTRFTLENGEVWEQIEPARVRLGKGAPDELLIKRRSFGSFIARVNGKRPSFKVRRVA
jgi:hypothetical protein